LFVDTTQFEVRTGDAFAVVDLTDRIADWLEGRGDGLCNVLAPHATAGLALLETGAGTEPDVATALAELLPRDDRWVHRHGSPGHGADHVLPLLVSSTLTLPVLAGRMDLGTWQSVVLVDPNIDNPSRTVRLAFVAG
jgi:secondary thiamine-phosphate synthase enzyme